MKAALDWLLHSEEATDSRGSAAYYAPLFGWGRPYPETTGYIIPTLYAGADRFGQYRYVDVANRMVDWLLSLQFETGAFPGGTKGPKSRPPSVFNSAQILFGLIETAERNGEAHHVEAARRTALWLVREQDDDGRWRGWAYKPGYSPSYYAHVCWPLAKYLVTFEPANQDIRRAVIRGLTAILEDRNPNGTFRYWAFSKDKPAFTHTVGYTLQGLLEAGRIVDFEEAVSGAIDSLSRLMLVSEVRKGLAGAYTQDWSSIAWYRCLTGHCQIADAWLRVHEMTADARFLNAAVKALEEVCRTQRLGGPKAIRGAIPGSSPLWGRYMAGRYPNWAAKFFVDAMLNLEKELSELRGEGRPHRDLDA